MKHITLCENPADPSTWTEHHVEYVGEFLQDHFKIWPDTARIYLEHVSKRTDITPADASGIARLEKVDGHLFVVVYPKGLELILIVVALVVSAVAIGLTFLFRPKVKSQNEQSPNNALGDRQNEARPNQRIPDVYGRLWATFDLLAVPYTEFINGTECEFCYMCIGRGDYNIEDVVSGASPVSSIRDDVTPLQQMEGATFGVYAPFTSPNSPGGASPIKSLGAPINRKVVNLQKFQGVNGQYLIAPDINTINGVNNIRFGVTGGNGFIENDGSIDFTVYFNVGGFVKIGGITSGDADATNGSTTVSLAGVYLIDAITPTDITLHLASTVNANWTTVAGWLGAISLFSAVTSLIPTDFAGNPIPTFTNQFALMYPQMTEIWVNFVCPQGLFTIDKNGNQQIENVTVQANIQQCDATGTPIGGESTLTATILGNITDRLQKGVTLKIVLSAGYAANGGVLIRAARITGTNLRAHTVTTDQTQWRDLYAISPLIVTDFGNVTTIQTAIFNTPASLSVPERKMNALVTRKLPVWSGSAFSGSAATQNAADIISAMALDPYIGNRTLAEIDVVGIYALAGVNGIIANYFSVFPDFSQAVQFCYTFDDSQTSFEESLADIAQAIFCVAYRRGNVLSLSFEQQTANSVVLFNHRNKIPNTETRTITFGTLNDNDGITLDYVEPNAPNYPNQDTTTTLYFPTNKSATNPKKVTAIGIRNVAQATILGWRLYRKLIFQNTNVQFDCTEEAALLVLQDRILVADNTRSDTQDGEVHNQSVLVLTLSQAVTFDSRFNYTIFLQQPDGTIDSIAISAGATPNQVILASPPSNACITDPSMGALTTYLIVNDAPVRQNAFLLAEKAPKDGKQFTVKAVNYDDEYYGHDKDFSTNVDIDGLFLEWMAHTPQPAADVDGLYLEAFLNGANPAVDVDGLYLEVMKK